MIKWIGKKLEYFKTIFKKGIRVESILEIGDIQQAEQRTIKGTDNPDGGGVNLNITASGASGTNQIGGGLVFFPGESTGNAVARDIVFAYSNPVASGSASQSTSSSLIINGNTGLCKFFEGIDINVTSSGVGLGMPTYPQSDSDTASTVIQNIQVGGATFNDNDTSLMTAAAILDKFSIIGGSSSIVTIGTITAGVWNGTVIASAYLDADTAHLTTAQTFTGSKTMGTNVKLNFRDANSYINSPTANDLEVVATDIVLDAAGSIFMEASDVTMYDPVNDGNPTISLGSSATNRFEIKTAYNSGAQTIDEVYFNTYTSSGAANDGRYIWQVDEVELAKLLDDGLNVTGYVSTNDAGAFFQTVNTTASSATEGGKLKLVCDDGAAMADNHRLGTVEFFGAEDASANRVLGASIEAFCEAGWSASENGARMVFSTTDGNASTSTVLTLDSNKLATFTGPIACTTRTLATTTAVDGNANGDVAYFGGTTSMTVGKIYHYKSDGTWEIANADAVSTSDGLLGVALGAASDTNGMLLRGFVTLDHDPGAIGDVLYVQSDNAGVPGNASATAPSVSGDCVRIIGYQVLHASNGNIWFNPDNTFVEVA